MAKTKPDTRFDVKRDRLRVFPDVTAAVFLPLFLIGLAVVLGITSIRVPLGWANIATLVFGSFAVVGVVFDKWRSDIERRARDARVAIEGEATTRSADAPAMGGQQEGIGWLRRTFSLWLHPAPPVDAGSAASPVAYTDDEKQKLADIDATMRSNAELRARFEVTTYGVLAVAAVSAGFSIAGELRVLFPG